MDFTKTKKGRNKGRKNKEKQMMDRRIEKDVNEEQTKPIKK